MTQYHDAKDCGKIEIKEISAEPVVLTQFVLKTKEVTVDVPVRVDKPFTVEVPIKKEVSVDWPVRNEIQVDWPVRNDVPVDWPEPRKVPVDIPDMESFKIQLYELREWVTYITTDVQKQISDYMDDMQSKVNAMSEAKKEMMAILDEVNKCIPDEIKIPKIVEEIYPVKVPEFVTETITVQNVKVEEETRKVIVPVFVREDYKVIGKIICTGSSSVEE